MWLLSILLGFSASWGCGWFRLIARLKERNWYCQVSQQKPSGPFIDWLTHHGITQDLQLPTTNSSVSLETELSPIIELPAACPAGRPSPSEQWLDITCAWDYDNETNLMNDAVLDTWIQLVFYKLEFTMRRNRGNYSQSPESLSGQKSNLPTVVDIMGFMYL